MKRRNFHLLGAGSVIALAAGKAEADVTPAIAATLKTSLTPLGAERAGNAGGTIPEWTGGFTNPPAFDPNSVPPDFFAADKILYTVNATNVGQYLDLLSDATVTLIQKNGLAINVYPTRRTACAPQWVYDNTYQNALNARAVDKGIRFGFVGAYGGTPFPIPGSGDDAGGKIIWNHLCRWQFSGAHFKASAFVVNGGDPALATTYIVHSNFPYYDPKGSLASFNGILTTLRVDFTAPPTLNGQQLIQYAPTNAVTNPIESWQLLEGQGRVRKAPQLAYDTPAAPYDGLGNYDEFFGFYGAPDRYNWKLIGKKEMLIPYNNNAIYQQEPFSLLGARCVNPEFVRWELHRVWVVDATLAAGARDVVPHRRVYIDEDTWMIGVADEWDAQGNIWRVSQNFNCVDPLAPGTTFGNTAFYNIQTGGYVLSSATYNDPKYGSRYIYGWNPAELFNPNALAAQSQF
jgi:hypothetical protein